MNSVVKAEFSMLRHSQLPNSFPRLLDALSLQFLRHICSVDVPSNDVLETDTGQRWASKTLPVRAEL